MINQLVNDRVRLNWQNHLIQGLGLKESTVDARLSSLTTYENFTGKWPFRLLDQKTAKSFRHHLVNVARTKNGELLSSSTIVHTICHVQAFSDG